MQRSRQHCAKTIAEAVASRSRFFFVISRDQYVCRRHVSVDDARAQKTVSFDDGCVSDVAAAGSVFRRCAANIMPRYHTPSIPRSRRSAMQQVIDFSPSRSAASSAAHRDAGSLSHKWPATALFIARGIFFLVTAVRAVTAACAPSPAAFDGFACCAATEKFRAET